MKTAFITGINGFIGSNLAQTLLQNNWTVKGLVLHGTSLEPIEGLDCEIIEGNILSPEHFIKNLSSVDCIFHLAAFVKDWGAEELFMRVNTLGTEKMLQAAVKAGVKRFLYMSSVAVHQYNGHFNATENTPRDCLKSFPYGQSKIQAEDLLRDYHEKGKIEGVIIRPAIFPFGPQDRTSFLPLAKALEKGLFAFVKGGKTRISTAYVENLCYGISLAGKLDEASGETFIISDNEPVTWRDLMNEICDELGVRKPFITIPFPIAKALAVMMEQLWLLLKLKGEPPVTRYRAGLMANDLHFVSNKAKKILGYEPIISRTAAIKKTVEWYHSKNLN